MSKLSWIMEVYRSRQRLRYKVAYTLSLVGIATFVPTFVLMPLGGLHLIEVNWPLFGGLYLGSVIAVNISLPLALWRL